MKIINTLLIIVVIANLTCFLIFPLEDKKNVSFVNKVETLKTHADCYLKTDEIFENNQTFLYN